MGENEHMQQEMRITKRLIVYAIISMIVAFLINVNIEMKLVCLDTVWISNELILSIVSGCFTGFLAVILEKIYKYRIDKSIAIILLYYNLYMLYAECYYWICNIKELEADKKLKIPKELFSGKLPLMNCYLSVIRDTDYVCFFKKDTVMEMHENFCINVIYKIEKVFNETKCLEMALNIEEINKLTQEESCGETYRVLHIMSGELQNVCSDVEIFIMEIDKKDKRVDWSRDKRKIVKSYLGLYNFDLKKFFENHSV